MKGWTVFILWQRQHNITNSPCAAALFGSQLHNCEEFPDYVDVYPSQILVPCIWCWQYNFQEICFLAMMMGQSGYPARNRRFAIFQYFLERVVDGWTVTLRIWQDFLLLWVLLCLRKTNMSLFRREKTTLSKWWVCSVHASFNRIEIIQQKWI